MTAATRARRYFEVAGAGGPVVLLHAGICDSGMWDPQWERLASGHRSVRCDFRGYGRSSLAPGTYSHPGDVIELLDELAAAGVDYDDVTDTLEEEGVQKFADSFEELLEGIRAKRGELVAA